MDSTRRSWNCACAHGRAWLKSARTNIAVGLVFLALAAALFVALSAAVLFAGRLPWALPILGAVFGAAGVRSIVAGFKARSEARELEARIGPGGG